MPMLHCKVPFMSMPIAIHANAALSIYIHANAADQTCTIHTSDLALNSHFRLGMIHLFASKLFRLCVLMVTVLPSKHTTYMNDSFDLHE